MSLLKNRYWVLSPIGRGGMGVVYKGVDTWLNNRFVAVKEMIQHNLNPQEEIQAVNAFRREALLLANLAHQNLPRIYDHFSQGNSSYLVMDFIEGKTLAELLRENPDQKLSIEDVLSIGEQLCSVLDYLHNHYPPVIFRDLKPANVMRTINNEHIYLIDFGIARFFRVGQLRDTLAFGTVGYAPPEQYGGQTTNRSDIYSLGATLHQLLTGLNPSTSKVYFSFSPICERNPQVPPLLESIIMQMVQVDPDKRPPSAAFIKQELQRIKQEVTFASAILASSNKSEVVVLVPKQGKERVQCIYNKHSDSVHSLAWAPDGKHIASCGRDKTVHVWSIDKGDKILAYKEHSSYVYGVSWSPDGKHIASASFKAVHVWNFPGGNRSVSYQGHPLWVYSVAWSPDSLYILSGGAEGDVHLWTPSTGDAICKYQGFTRVVKTVAWSAKTYSGKVVCGCEDFQLYSWDISVNNAPLIYQGHKNEVSSVAWSPDESRVVSGSRDKTVRIWNAVTGQVSYIYKGHAKEVYTVAWSPDSSLIASAGEDKTVHVWNAITGQKIHTYKGHAKAVYAVAWSPDGSLIASAGEDKTVHVWQVP